MMKRRTPMQKALDLTAGEERVFDVLMNVESISWPDLNERVYGRPLRGPKDGIIKVRIFRIREKLQPHGLTIHWVFGQGYSLDEATKTRVREMYEATS